MTTKTSNGRKAVIKRAWGWFDWNLFLFVVQTNEEELATLPIKLLFILRRYYDIFMALCMCWSFTFAFAIMYENMSMAAFGVIIPNLAQITPLLVWLLIIFYSLGVGLWMEGKFQVSM